MKTRLNKKGQKIRDWVWLHNSECKKFREWVIKEIKNSNKKNGNTPKRKR